MHAWGAECLNGMLQLCNLGCNNFSLLIIGVGAGKLFTVRPGKGGNLHMEHKIFGPFTYKNIQRHFEMRKILCNREDR